MTIFIFAVYLLLVLFIGIYAGSNKVKNEESYFLGDRGYGPFTTAISIGSTDSSGWIFIGAVGFAYTVGAGSMWMMPGFLIGAFINWLYLGEKLRRESKELNALSLVDFFGKKLNNSKAVTGVAGFLVVLFFIPYLASQLTAAGKTTNVLLNIDYNVGLVGSAIFVVAYCLIGGYRSVMITDVVQGTIMLIVLFLFPLYLIYHVGGWSVLWNELLAVEPLMGSATFGATGALGFGFIAGLIFYGLGEVGQPHTLQRFISAKDSNTVKHGAGIAFAWMIIVMTGSSILGITARFILPNLDDPEYAFPTVVIEIMPTIMAGIVVAAIFAAIQSTFSSQLLMSVQTLSSDLLKIFSKKVYSQEQLVKGSRITMIILGIVGTLLALANIDTVFLLVVYAWSGMASAFGPLLVLLLISPRLVSNVGAISGMLGGTIISTTWYVLGLGEYMMEAVPGMISALIIIVIISKLFPNKSTLNVK